MKLVYAFLFLLSSLILLSFPPTYAATLKFNASTFTISQGEKKKVTVVLDTEGRKAFGAVATIKITSGADVIKINSVVPTTEIDTNEMRVTDSTSVGDNRVSFTVIKEVGSYFEGVSNLAILEVEGLKNGTAKIEVVTSDTEPSTVADFDTNDELLSTLGSATFNFGSSSTNPTIAPTNSSNDDDNGSNDDGENVEDKDTESSSNYSSTTASKPAVPETGDNFYFYIMFLVGSSLFCTSFLIRKVVSKL